jgi:fatty-acyl-CoA synthase
VAWNTFTTLVHELRPGDVTLTHTPMFRSEKPASFPYTMEAMADAARELARGLGAERPVFAKELLEAGEKAVVLEYLVLDASGWFRMDDVGARALTTSACLRRSRVRIGFATPDWRR